MKRISMSTTYTQQEIKIVSNRGKENEVKMGMTRGKMEKTQLRNEKQSINVSSCQLFGFNKLATCISSEKKDTKANSANYHKLRYRRVSGKSMSNNRIQTQTESMKQFFTETKSTMPINTNNSVNYNTSSLSFITFSPYDAKTNSSIAHHAKPSAITSTSVSSLLTIPQTHYCNPRQNRQKMEDNLSARIIDVEIVNPKGYNSQGFSTLDSYRVKQNLQETLHSRTPHRLLIVSKLSQSISVKEQDNSNGEIESRHMGNQELKDSRNMRQLDSPIKYFASAQYDNKDLKLSQVSAQSNGQSMYVNSIKTIRPENLPSTNRYKTLADCGNTIISLYNKSSQKKSRLQESSVVFQASKQVSSDQIISVELDHVKINKNYNKFDRKTFLRTQRKSLTLLERTSYDNNDVVEVDDIEFDPNTLTEYGAL